MKLHLLGGREAVACAAIGLAGAMIFLFAFPKGSISTLMHAVLELPGPGAGIGLVLGPFLVLVALVSSLLSRGAGAAVVASLVFAVACVVVVRLTGVSVNPKGAFGSALFVAAVAQFCIVAEAVMVLGRAMREVRRCMLSGALANAALLTFYWTVVFPRTTGWVRWTDVPLLIGLALAGGLVSGCIAWGASKPLARAMALTEEE